MKRSGGQRKAISSYYLIFQWQTWIKDYMRLLDQLLSYVQASNIYRGSSKLLIRVRNGPGIKTNLTHCFPHPY
jgi:hypothetical protein